MNLSTLIYNIGFVSCFFYAVLIFCSLYFIIKYYNVRISGEAIFSNNWVFYSACLAAGQGASFYFYGVEEPLTHISDGFTQFQSELLTSLLWGGAAWWGYFAITLAILGCLIVLNKNGNFNRIFNNKVLLVLFNISLIISCVAGIPQSFAFASERIGHLSESIGFRIPLLATIAIITISAIISYLLGIKKGIKYVSIFTLTVDICVLLLVLLSNQNIIEDTLEGLSIALLTNIYNLPALLGIGIDSKTMSDWVIPTMSTSSLSWLIFSSMFFARISLGKTVKEIFLGIVVIPAIWHSMWFTVFTNYAIDHNFTTMEQVFNNLFLGKAVIGIVCIGIIFMVIATMDSMMYTIKHFVNIEGYWIAVPVVALAVMGVYFASDSTVTFQRFIGIIPSILGGLILIYVTYYGLKSLDRSLDRSFKPVNYK